MVENTTSNVSPDTLPYPIFCPMCGLKLIQVKEGVKESCGYDDCHAQFSIRIYHQGLHQN